MILTVMSLMIIILTVLLFILINDRVKMLRIIGVITIMSSVLLIVLSFVVRLIVNNTVTGINISNITRYLFNKFLYTGIILMLMGIIEMFLSKYIYNKNRIIMKKTSN